MHLLCLIHNQNFHTNFYINNIHIRLYYSLTSNIAASEGAFAVVSGLLETPETRTTGKAIKREDGGPGRSVTNDYNMHLRIL